MLRCCLIVFVALGCASPPAEPAPLAPSSAAPTSQAQPSCEAPNLVCVGDVGITEAALKARLDELDPLMRRQTIASRNGSLSLFVNEALLVQEAKRRGLHMRPAISGQLARYEARVLTRALMEELTTEAMSDKALRAHHQRHADWYRDTGLQTILHARFKETKTGKGLPQKLVLGVEAALKKRTSLPELQRRFPEVAFELLEPGTALEPAVANRAKFLGRGENSERFWVGDEMRIIQIAKLKLGPVSSFEDARARIETELRPSRFAKAYKGIVQRLKSEIPVVRNQALIGAMQLR